MDELTTFLNSLPEGTMEGKSWMGKLSPEDQDKLCKLTITANNEAKDKLKLEGDNSDNASDNSLDLENKVETVSISQPRVNLEAMSVIQLLKHKIPTGWESAFKESWDTIVELSEILELQEKKYGPWFPLKEDLFRALDLVSPDKVRVIIMGQDPYHGMGKTGYPQAMGLSFSVRKGETIPPSLRNVFAELSTNIEGFQTPYHGDLTSWAKQGVLLLNSCLTVRKGEPESHKDVWKAIIICILKQVEHYNPKCIALIWGKKASKYKPYLPSKSIILDAPHPSSMNNGRAEKFLGCKHFTKVNDLLKAAKEVPIDWNLD